MYFLDSEHRNMNILEEGTYKLLLKIGGSLKKLGEMDELEMGPVNIFFPRSASIPVLSIISSSHFKIQTKSVKRKETKFQAALTVHEVMCLSG